MCCAAYYAATCALRHVLHTLLQQSDMCCILCCNIYSKRSAATSAECLEVLLQHLLHALCCNIYCILYYQTGDNEGKPKTFAQATMKGSLRRLHSTTLHSTTLLSHFACQNALHCDLFSKLWCVVLVRFMQHKSVVCLHMCGLHRVGGRSDKVMDACLVMNVIESRMHVVS